jgi:hypothetical protein
MENSNFLKLKNF